jgi:hypothetical protein
LSFRISITGAISAASINATTGPSSFTGGLTVASGGLTVTGGIWNTGGGITSAGPIAGATTIAASGEYKIYGLDQSLEISCTNQSVFNNVQPPDFL